MKYSVLIAILAVFSTAACSREESSATAPSAPASPTKSPVVAAAPTPVAPVPASAPVATSPVAPVPEGGLSVEEGKALGKKSGCFACHGATLDRTVIGPAWNDVGTKYKGDPAARENLIKWVHVGGTGRWGTAVMPPYSPRVPDEEIEKLVDFILSLPRA